MLNIIFFIFVGVTVLLLIYCLGIFAKFAFAKPKAVNPKKIPVSVIVCAKNKAEKVKQYIPLLAAQDYPDYEIILIDDSSSDDTLDIFEEFEKQYSNIKLVKVANNEAFWANKKYALTLGIKAATKEYLLFTDADCYPASDTWITQMTAHFTLKKTIVLGYSSYEKVKNSLFNKLIRFDAMFTATQYFAWAKSGRPYTGEGQNLAYKREEFFKVNGFINHINIRTGEDALFINEAASKKNTTTCFTPESFTYCEAKKTFSEWFAQKRRQEFTTGFFRAFDKFQLRFYNFCLILFYLLAVVLLAFSFNWMLVVPVIGVRYLFTWVTLGYSAAKLNEKDVMYLYPFLEIMLTFTKTTAFFSNMFSKPVHWK